MPIPACWHSLMTSLSQQHHAELFLYFIPETQVTLNLTHVTFALAARGGHSESEDVYVLNNINENPHVTFNCQNVVPVYPMEEITVRVCFLFL